MAVVAQLVEPLVVVQVVVGSSPIDRPISPFICKTEPTSFWVFPLARAGFEPLRSPHLIFPDNIEPA